MKDELQTFFSVMALKEAIKIKNRRALIKYGCFFDVSRTNKHSESLLILEYLLK